MRRLIAAGALLVCIAGCSEPPQKELDQAQGAVDTARAAGADQYAPDDYNAATTSLQKAHDAVDQRDYRQALSYALDGRQRAFEAARLVPEARTHARTAAESAFKTASERANRLDTLLREAKEARVPARELRSPQETLTAARRSLQEARKLIDAGSFSEAAAVLPQVRENLDLAAASIASIPPHPRPAKSRNR